MNLTKLVDGARVFVRNQIYENQPRYKIPKYLHTSEERRNVSERKKMVDSLLNSSPFMLNTYPKDFVDELTKEDIK